MTHALILLAAILVFSLRYEMRSPRSRETTPYEVFRRIDTLDEKYAREFQRLNRAIYAIENGLCFLDTRITADGTVDKDAAVHWYGLGLEPDDPYCPLHGKVFKTKIAEPLH